MEKKKRTQNKQGDERRQDSPASEGRGPSSSELNGGVVVEELNVAWPQLVAPHEVLVARGSLVLVVACKHALDAHADALRALHGAPALRSEEVEANDAVGVDVRVYRNRAAR